MKQLKTLILFLSLIMSLSVFAQRERNYIYLLDCTKSMIGYNGSPKIWDPTRNYLKTELEKHTPGTTLHVVPFQGKVLPAFSCDANNLNWKNIDSELQKHVQNVTNTNICDAWDAIDKFIDKHKDNYIILLTDGKDNVNGMAAVAKKLSDWCGKYPNSYAFYVQLTEDAIDPSVAKVINICDNEFVIDASKGIPVFGSFDKGLIIYANTLNLDRIHKIGFSSVGKYTAKAVCSDPYFDVKVVGDKIEGGIVPVQIVAKQPISQINAALPQIYNFTFDVESNDVSIINPTVKVQMTNKPERSLQLLQEETYIGKATWYDSFLFWGASDQDTLSIDLKAKFNDEAKKDGSTIELSIKDADGENDFQLFYNNHLIKNGKIIINSNDRGSSILSIVFNPEAKEGKRYLNIVASNKHELDNINDQPIEQYKVSLRSEYVVNWNPLKTILMWLAIIILAALLLWFILVKHFIYPSIGVKTIQINDPYFCKVNVKGKRRVVFTNKKVEQSLINRIFTGEILYKTNDVWTSPLAFEAGAKKKTLRVMRTMDYTFDPYSSTLKAPNDYVVENNNNNTKIKISIN
ncbi:MAG: hypothetical protein VZR53_07225 [Prevotella sp.]|nr:hypothetical protein [Prevotella sp.]